MSFSIRNKMAKDIEQEERLGCELCENTFTTKHGLKRHVEAVHEKIRKHMQHMPFCLKYIK